MFSILIPTYDYTCYKLVLDLHAQAEALAIPYEIIVAEDGSKSPVNIIANHKIIDLPNCRHIIYKIQRGPAGIRNIMATEAQHEWIIFIDSDAKVDNPRFLESYVASAGKAEVIVGGLHHQDVNYNPNLTLRFKYEKKADASRSAACRSLNPYGQFSTFNFMIRRTTFLSILFDRECRDYGYEDALFGVELERRHVSILHIDNSLLHMGLDENPVFLRKTETALRTLRRMNGKMDGHSRLVNTYNRIASLHLQPILRILFRIFRSMLRKNLLSSNPSLLLFNLYKLGYYSAI